MAGPTPLTTGCCAPTAFELVFRIVVVLIATVLAVVIIVFIVVSTLMLATGSHSGMDLVIV